MNEGHQKTSSELSKIVKGRSGDLPLPPKLDAEHERQLSRLQELEGEAFTKRYRADQIAAHKRAVSLFQRYAEKGQDNKLKAFAEKTLPELRAHLDMALNLGK